MPPVLSYPALKCVLEHLEATKRFHIAARSPALKRINELIPVHLKHLGLDVFGVTVNQIIISSGVTCETKDSNPRSTVTFKIKYSDGGVTRNVPNFLEVQAKLLEYYLKKVVHVDDVHCGFSIPTLPSSLTLKINRLYSYSTNEEDFFSKIPSDSQVKEFKLFVPRPIILDRPIVNSVERLILLVYAHYETETRLPDIHKLPNKNVIIVNESGNDEIKSDELSRIIRYWKEHGKEIGTEFLLYFSNDRVFPMLTKLKKELNGITGFNEENDHSHICIQLTPTSQVILYVIEMQTNQKMEYSLVVKVVPIQH